MARKEMTMDRFLEIKRLLELNISIHEIARTMKCTRRTVRQIRDGLRGPNSLATFPAPLWTEQLDWQEILEEVLAAHPLKLIWEEKAAEFVTYVNFWKQFHKKFPHYKQATVVHRYFDPGERCEVDYAGKYLEWVDLKTGLIHKASVFIGILGFSQLMFAMAKENLQSRNFLDCHNKMYAYFGGVPKITVPDCLKQGVTRCHLYDPEINSSYQDLAAHFSTAIVPARPRHPKDKALVEGAVKLIMRYFRWSYRKHTFVSLDEINKALIAVVCQINQKIHSRFKVSRYERWEKVEKEKLQELPEIPYEFIQWKQAVLHPDCHVSVESRLYSAPHIYRGKTLKIKMTDSFVEIFHELSRVALHKRQLSRGGPTITVLDHLPENAKAYLEATPQNILCQAKYLNADLSDLIEGLFKQNALAHLRRAQGFIREARKEIKSSGKEKAGEVIKKAILIMAHYDKIRVPYFRELLNRYRLEVSQQISSHIERKPNPLLRHTQPQMDLILH